jgi:hypothetical protein
MLLTVPRWCPSEFLRCVSIVSYYYGNTFVSFNGKYLPFSTSVTSSLILLPSPPRHSPWPLYVCRPINQSSFKFPRRFFNYVILCIIVLITHRCLALCLPCFYLWSCWAPCRWSCVGSWYWPNSANRKYVRYFG